MSRFHAILITMVSLLLMATLAPRAGATDPAAQAAATSEPVEVEIPRDLDLDASNFGEPTVIDNEWFSLEPGVQMVTAGESLEDDAMVPHRIESTVTDLTKTIQGIETRVVWVIDYANEDEIIEKEIAFYAQDDAGQVWYLGEYREEYDGDLVDPRAWVAGHADAHAGIAMPAEPRAGTGFYSQGWGPAIEWSDMARIVSMGNETISTPTGTYDDILVMDETSDDELAMGAFQQKYYARDVGLIRVGFTGDDMTQETLELIEINRLDEDAMAEIRAEALALEARAYESVPEEYGETIPLE